MGMIDVKEQLPKPGKQVLALMKYPKGREVFILAMWIPKFYREFNDGWGELEPDYKDEDDEIGYWPEGWYECVECWEDLDLLAVWEPVTHWCDITLWRPCSGSWS